MTTGIVVFDVDDVLVDFWPPVIRLIDERTGNHFNKNELVHYDSVCDHISHEGFLQLATEAIENHMHEPNKRIVEIARVLKTLGYELHMVTNRGYVDRLREGVKGCHELTCEWLDMHNVPYDEVHIVPEGTAKAVYIKTGIIDSFTDAPRKIEMIFEDKVETIIHSIHCDVVSQIYGYCYIIDQPWNQLYKDIHLPNTGHFVPHHGVAIGRIEP